MRAGKVRLANQDVLVYVEVFTVACRHDAHGARSMPTSAPGTMDDSTHKMPHSTFKQRYYIYNLWYHYGFTAKVDLRYRALFFSKICKCMRRPSRLTLLRDAVFERKTESETHARADVTECT